MPAPKGNKNPQKAIEPRTERFEARMRKSEKELMESLAENEGISSADLLEKVVLAYPREKKERKIVIFI